VQTLNNITVTANTSQAVSAVQVLNNQWTEMNNALSLVGRGLSTAANLAGSFVAVGSKIENVNKAAQAMSKYGLGKGMLQALRAETADVVDQMVLAQNATKLLGSGAVQSVKEMTDAFKWAITQGDRIGVSANEAVQLITNTLIGGEAEALKRFGVQMELTGTKAEKTSKLMQMIQKEIKFSDDAFAVTAAGFGEKMQQMKNSMLDAVEGFSLFNKGFNLISGSVEWVTKKLKKSTGEIWSDIEVAGKMGMQKLQDDVARTVSALTSAKVSGDTASVDFLQKKLDKTMQDGQAFLLQFSDLYDQFGKAAGAAEPVQIKQDVTEVLAIARGAAQAAEADIDKALDKITQLDERGLALAKRDAKDAAYKLEQRNKDLEYWTKRHMSEAKSSDSEELISKRLQLQSEVRQDILKIANDAAAASNMVYLLEQGQDELLRRKDRILAGHFSTLLKTLDTERKAVEERRKYGKILDNGVAAEKNLEAMKKDYIAILDGQLKIATQLNDQAKMKYLIEAKDKAAAIKTLAEFEAQLKEQEVKEEKKKTEAKIDEEKRELAFLRLRLKLASESGYSADVIAELNQQVSQLEKITKLTGSARVAEIDRGRAIAANEQTMQKAESERTKAKEAQEARDKAAADEERKLVDERLKRIRLFSIEQTKVVESLRARYAELQESQLQSGPEGTRILQTMEMIGRGAQQLAADTEKLAQPTQEQIELYKRLSEEFAKALASGDQKLADSLRYRMTLMRSEATTIEEIAKKGRESESKLLYAQYAQESLRQSIADKELELKAALRDKSYERAAALRDEITALQQQAEANGQAMKKMEEIQRQYKTLGEVGSSAISAISQAAWADKEALEKYHGSRLKMAQDLFADEMKKKAISETVLGFAAAGQAALASVFAPPAAPALWASSALHFLAAGATGLIGAGLDVSTGTGGGGGGGSAASSAKTGIGDTAPESYKPQEVVVNVSIGAKDGWVGNMVDAIVDNQRRGKARRGVM
jgi:hypothetical protein